MSDANSIETPPPEAPEEPVRADPAPELNRLLDLAAKYPEIGPPLAELAFKIGQHEFGDRVVRMGLERAAPGLEYYFVAANAARREARHADALRYSVEAVRTYAAAADDVLAPDDGARLLHLVRLGFSTLLFDVKDAKAAPEFVAGLASELPALERRLGADAFFHTLLAQVRWYEDRAASEEEWERAAELGEPELTWNARGTWYKEADRDLDAAARAYRKGLEQAPRSPLLLHNLAQVLVDKAALPETDVEHARRLLREADDHLRAALREESPKGLRRHVHTTRDRLNVLRSSLPPRGPAVAPAASPSDAGEGGRPAEPERELEVGETVKGRVVSLTAYGAFLSLGGGRTGLLHKTEMAHASVADPAQVLKVGDDLEVRVIEVERREGARTRIGLSRRALLPPPPGAPAEPAAGGDAAGRRAREARDGRGGGGRGEGRGGDRQDRRDRPDRGPGGPGGPGGGRGGRGPGEGRPEIQKYVEGKIASLGEMLLAKLKEQEPKG